MSSVIVRTTAAVFLAGALVVACSGSESTSSIGNASSSGGAGSSGASGVVGASSGSGGTSSSSSSGVLPGAIDLDSIITITASEDTCGKVAGVCLDAQAFTIDFLKSTITNTTCVELAGGPDAGASSGGTQDATTSHALTPDQINVVKSRLAALKTSSTPLTGFDGPIWTLEVTTKTSGTVIYSPEAGCGPQEKMVKIESGWPDLWDTLRGL
jgi:hypothetical protein